MLSTNWPDQTFFQRPEGRAYIYGYTIENLSNTDTQIILTYRHRGHSLNTGIDTMASGQYTPNKKNVDIHKSYYRVLNHFFSSNQFLNTVHKVIKREQLFVFR